MRIRPRTAWQASDPKMWCIEKRKTSIPWLNSRTWRRNAGRSTQDSCGPLLGISFDFRHLFYARAPPQSPSERSICTFVPRSDLKNAFSTLPSRHLRCQFEEVMRARLIGQECALASDADEMPAVPFTASLMVVPLKKR